MRGGRPSCDKETHPALCYFHSPDRKADRPEGHLKDFTGILHADAYAGYNRALENSKNDSKNNGKRIERAGCWAHARRKFYKITIASSNARVALDALDDIGKIYDIEKKLGV